MRTQLDKMWDAHVVESIGPGVDLLQVDFHLLTELHSRLFADFEQRGLSVFRPQRTFGT